MSDFLPPIQIFDLPLHPLRRPDGGIGRRVGLKHQWGNTRAGSTPALGTALNANRLFINRLAFFYCKNSPHFPHLMAVNLIFPHRQASFLMVGFGVSWRGVQLFNHGTCERHEHLNTLNTLNALNILNTLNASATTKALPDITSNNAVSH